VEPEAETVFRSDTLYYADSLAVDSLTRDTVPVIDTIVHGYVTEYSPMDISMQMFTEYHFNQYLTADARLQWAMVAFAFNEELDEQFGYELISPEPSPGDCKIEEMSPENDSLVIWITDSNIYKQEELLFRVQYTSLDSNGEEVLSIDTLDMNYSQKQEEAAIRKGKLPERKKAFVSAFSLNELYNDGVIMSLKPLIGIDTSLIDLYRKKDTLFVPEPYQILPDSTSALKQGFVFEKMPDSAYRLIFDTLAFTNIYYEHNDSTGYDFTIMNEMNYGSISLFLTNVPEQAIVTLKKGTLVLEEMISEGDEMIVMDKLLPGNLTLELILDNNRDGEWSTGDYIEGRQPERVLVYPEKINLKGGFEHMIEWDINLTGQMGQEQGDGERGTD
jgi:hypothetical protein